MPWMTLLAASTTEVFIPAGPWDSASGISGAKALGELRGQFGNAQVRAAVQLANDVRSPDAATAIGTATSTNGPIDPTQASVSSSGKTYIRPGWLVSLSSGGTLAGLAVSGTITYEY
jgi:hypothetical protein